MVAIGIAIVVAEKTVFRAVSDGGSGLERFGGVFGTVVSAAFLLLIGLLNLVILAGIARIFRSMRRGEFDEAELERQLEGRGFFYRFFGRWMKAITAEWELYPVGVVFGLGFDTGIEVLSLVPQEIGGFSRSRGFWGLMYHFNINTAGFVIVGMFVLTWLAALLIWRFGRIEENGQPGSSPEHRTAQPASPPDTALRGGSPRPSRRSVAAQNLPPRGLGLGGAVRVQEQHPAPLVNADQMMELAQEDALPHAGLAALGLVVEVAHLASGGGPVAAARPPAVLRLAVEPVLSRESVPGMHKRWQGRRDRKFSDR